MAWKGESRRHSMARKGIKTSNGREQKVDTSSGIWFQSDGLLGEMVTLVQLMGFDDLMKDKKASGIKKDQYECDAGNMVIYPSDKTKKTAEWLMKEYVDGNNTRKKQVKRMLNIAIKRLDQEIPKSNNIDIRIDLHESRKMLRSLEKELN